MLAIDLFVKELPLICARSAATDALPCIAKLEQTLYSAAKILEFEYVRFTCWHKEVTDRSAFPLSFSINFSNFPKMWEKLYEARRYYLNDPVVRVIAEADHSQLSSGTWQQAWQDVEAREAALGLERMQELSKDAIQHGVVAGFYMTLVTGLNRFVISLGTSRSAEDVERQASGNLQRQIFSLVALLSQTMSLTQGCISCGKPLRIQGGDTVKLTKKQCEVLRIFSEHAGATNVDVARISHVTTETIAFHLKAIRRKFNQPHASGHALSNIAMQHGLL